MSIHSTAIIHTTAKVPASCSIGPYCVVGAEVELGENCELLAHVVLHGPAKLGRGNRLFPFCSVGVEPQDLSYKGEPTRLEIGDNNVVREYVSIHRGTTKGGGLTKIGSNCLIMAYSHIAHDCLIGNHVIFANGATLAGHVTVEDHAVLPALGPVHQFCRVGEHAYIGGGTVVTQDVLPYSKTSAAREVSVYGVNTVGLERRGFSKERIREIQKAFKTLIAAKLNTSQAVEKLRSGEMTDEVRKLVEFVEGSERGVIK